MFVLRPVGVVTLYCLGRLMYEYLARNFLARLFRGQVGGSLVTFGFTLSFVDEMTRKGLDAFLRLSRLRLNRNAIGGGTISRTGGTIG